MSKPAKVFNPVLQCHHRGDRIGVALAVFFIRYTDLTEMMG